ncbi:MAG: 1-deoxy-D-xylulose-5-phosphate synthase [Deltaproteobacteria bacterium]|nr:1-deoxy-D-xylulose-5-phosphate synthase [Deltaproteobacteria bacterium]
MALLDRIQNPADLRRLPRAELPALCAELRDAMVAACTPVGGHLGGSLGAVELIVALHRAFDTPRDLLVIDTGHQAYAHKLLTGRRALLEKLRQEGGAAGFLERHESEFDAWGAGHASTGLSAAIGLAEASARLGQNRRVAVLVGDGALTGGLSFEALNNLGTRDVTIVLNDNGMSIAPNVGAIAKLLGNTSADPMESLRRVGNSIAMSLRSGQRPHLEALAPGPRAFFEALGISYLGPVDGHDVEALERALADAKSRRGPVLVHARTQKGRGLALAEADVETRGHAMGPFDAQGRLIKKAGPPSFTDVFADGLAQLMEGDERIVAITAAMPDGTGLARVARRFPDRVFDVGIAEAHAVTFAAGLAAGGLRPVVAIYSTFMQRALDGVIHDVCLQNLPVTFALDRAGLVGGDGATHQGAFDVAYLRAIPNLALMAPSDENELRHLLATAVMHNGPAAIRFPRGAGPGAKMDPVPQPQQLGRARVYLRTAVRAECTVLALGPALHAAALAARTLADEGLRVTVVDARFVKPLDEDAVLEAATLGPIVTVEHAALAGGFGSAVLELLESKNVNARVKRLGLPDAFVAHGDANAQYAKLGLDAAGIASAVRALVRVRAAEDAS